MINFSFLKGSPKDSSGHGAGKPGDDPQHIAEMDQFRTVLKSMGATRIEDRLKVLEVLLSTEQHVIISELAELVREREPELHDMNFLKATMEMFCECGFAQRREFDARDVAYEHLHLGTHHDHFICTACGAIKEFHNSELEALQQRIAAGFNFHPLQHKMEIYGLCSECMASREPNPPLLLIAVGEKAKIVEIGGDRKMQGRLAAMGLSVGTVLEVITSNPAGPFIVAANDMRLALDAPMAQSIKVVHHCRLPSGDEAGHAGREAG